MHSVPGRRRDRLNTAAVQGVEMYMSRRTATAVADSVPVLHLTMAARERSEPEPVEKSVGIVAAAIAGFELGFDLALVEEIELPAVATAEFGVVAAAMVARMSAEAGQVAAEGDFVVKCYLLRRSAHALRHSVAMADLWAHLMTEVCSYFLAGRTPVPASQVVVATASRSDHREREDELS
jgi:hypothetical protein